MNEVFDRPAGVDLAGSFGYFSGVGHAALPENATEEQYLEFFLRQAKTVVNHGKFALEIEASDPAVTAALSAVFPGNPLIRIRDYEGPDRRWQNPVLSQKVGETYLAGLHSGTDVMEMVAESEAAVSSWRDFLLGPEVVLAESDQLTDDQWQRISASLDASPAKLLQNFARFQSAALVGKRVSKPAKRNIIQTRQTMLPYALMRLAYCAFPDNTESKASNFAQELFTSTVEARRNPEILNRLPFTSVAVRDAYIAIMRNFGQILHPEKDDNNQNFLQTMVEQVVAMGMIDRFDNAGAFYNTAGRLLNDAEQYAFEFIFSLNLDRDPDTAFGKFGMKLLTIINNAAGTNITDITKVDAVSIAPGTAVRRALIKELENINYRRTDFLMELQCLLQARALMDGIYGRHVFYPEQLADSAILSLANEKPLAVLARRREEEKHLFELWEVVWPIAPPDTGSMGPREERVSAQPETNDMTFFDEHEGDRRLEWLKHYMFEWKKGRVALVRSKLPSLTKNQQYYIALLQEALPDGRVIWHAIADHANNRAIGQHGVLMFRAEAGIDKFGRIRRTWDELFSLHKKPMCKLGVVALRHTATLGHRVDDFLNANPESISRYESFGSDAEQEAIEMASRNRLLNADA